MKILKKQINNILLKQFFLNQVFFIIIDNFLLPIQTNRISKNQLKFIQLSFLITNLELKYPLNLKSFVNFTLLSEYLLIVNNKFFLNKSSIWLICFFNILCKTDFLFKKFNFLNLIQFFKKKKYYKIFNIKKII